MDDGARHLDVDGELRRLFSGMAQPCLSPYFRRTLRQRLALERRRLRALRRRRLVMSVYWLFVLVATVFILQHVAWPDQSSRALWLTGTVVSVSFLLAAAIVRSLRTGLVDLILSTVDRSWRLDAPRRPT